MHLLGSALYDPATAVNKVTTAALAMTAIDTTNLRLTVTVPSHGKLRVRLMACLHGAATYPSILLGVMEGATVRGRIAPVQSLGNTAVATALVNVEADFVISGLTPGAIVLDAAYAVETLVVATGLKYGGPNNATANDAFGGFVFEIWDPAPNPTNFGLLSVDANGRVDVIKIAGTAQTAGDVMADTNDIQTRLPAALVGGRIDASVGAMAANVVTAAAVNAAALNGKGDWNIGKTGYALSAAGVQAIWDALTSALTFAGSIGKLLVDNINATISSRHASGAAVASVSGSVGSVATAGITAPSFGVGAIDALAVATDAANEIADALLDRNMGTGTDSGSPTVRTMRQALRMLRNKAGIAAGTLTVTKEDDTTASWTATVTTAAGNPISEVDPASA